MRVRETMNPMDVTPVPPSPVSSDDLTIIAAQLGRQPRGVIAIAYRCPDGVPGVVTTSPRLPDGTPFPTLYYLTDPRLTAEASRLEVAHVMNWMTDRLNTDLELRADYQRAHDYYLAKRNALAEVAKRDVTRFVAADLGFSIGPRLNAAGRLDNMSVGVELLLAENMETARALALELDGLNQARKEIEQGMKLEALTICQNLFANATALETDIPHSIVLYQSDWHQGVLGILASRIKEQFHRPVIAFAQDQAGILKGSARSIPGLHIRDVLERVYSQHPDLILKFGGHAMAAGLSIQESRFDDFRQIFNQTVSELLAEDQLQGTIWTDGELNANLLNLATAETLRQGGPWGQAFPEPLFDGEFKILQQRLVGEKHLKMMVEPKLGGPLLDAIAFNIDTRYYPDLSIKTARFAYKLDINEFRGNRDLQLLVDYIEPLES